MLVLRFVQDTVSECKKIDMVFYIQSSNQSYVSVADCVEKFVLSIQMV